MLVLSKEACTLLFCERGCGELIPFLTGLVKFTSKTSEGWGGGWVLTTGYIYLIHIGLFKEFWYFMSLRNCFVSSKLSNSLHRVNRTPELSF